MGQSLSSFHRFVAQGLLPQPVKIGGATRWKRSDLEAAVAAMPPAGHRRPRGRAAHKAREARL
jgi:predicted DNA-binding transcriptional regulator AlpA